jgi:hypothetical protein
MRRFVVSTCLLALSVAACGADGDGPDDAECSGAKCDAVDDDETDAARMCVGVRGNGQLIFAHFASLARIAEHYGPVWGAAGGSSGSITMFVLDSMQLNPAIATCGTAECTRAEQGVRIAALLKSMNGYAAALGETPEAAAVGQLAPLAKRFADSGIAALAETDPVAAQTALLDLLQSEDLRDLVNPEIIDTITSSPDPAFHVRDLATALAGLGSFDVGCTPEQAMMGCNSKAIFVRPGLLDFPSLVEKIGRIGDFYAGLGPQDASRWYGWLDGCAAAGKGKSWPELAAAPLGASTCGDEFAAMITEYRNAVTSSGARPVRLDQPIGGSLAALVSTSVLTGAAVDTFARARADYDAGSEYTLDVAFDDVKFGYWGAADDLAKVESNALGFDDAKTKKFLSLGTATWGEALAFSPAEPGLARALEIDDTHVSAGGWSDLHPTLVLANLGCEEIVYVTRRGDESGFATGVATELGMDAAAGTALYDLDAESSFATSIAEADAVWCTDWNAQSPTDLAGVFADGYGAPMQSSAPFFTDAAEPYAQIREDLALRGCSPGA